MFNLKKKKKKKKKKNFILRYSQHIRWIIFDTKSFSINLNQIIMVQIYRLYDNILKDDGGTSIIAFINALVLSTAGHAFDSHYDETNDNESNAASRISTMISAYFDCEYYVLTSDTW